MNSPCCSSDCLAKLLEHQLDDAEESIVLSHLNHCSSCRSQLESLTAEPGFWNEIGVHLQPKNLNQNFHRFSNPVRSAPSDSSDLLSGNNERQDSDYLHSAAEHLTTAESSASESKSSDQVAAIHFIKQLLVPTDDPDSIGKLGIYEIKGIIGVGGMGIVLKGLDASLHRTVAIKVLSPHLTTNGAARQRFAREAQAAASVVHENVMAIHAIDEWQGVPYFVMPMVRGESLEKRLKRTGALDLLEILRIARQVAAGLHAAHQQGLVHRDIKPANILMEHGSERLKIADFGLARAGDDASLTRSGHILGTPLYMSPEQARGEHVDARSDIFSFGSLLYALSTGHPPFRAETPYGVIRRLCEEEPRSIQEYNPTIPFWLSGIIERMISKRAEDRFGSTVELANLFAAGLVYSQQSIETELPTELRPFVRSSEQYQSRLGQFSLQFRSGAFAVMLVAVFLGVGYWAWGHLASPTFDKWPAGARAIVGDDTATENSLQGTQLESAPAGEQDPLPGIGNSELPIVTTQNVETAARNSEAQNQGIVVQPAAQDLVLGYHFRLGEPLKYRCEIELTSTDHVLLVTGDIELSTVAVEDDYAEFDYQIRWDPTRLAESSSDERPIASAGSDTKFLTRQPLGMFPMLHRGFAPSIQIPPFLGETPFSRRPMDFGFELQELQNCELVGRAKIGNEGKLLGCSHRSELPGQFGRVLDWIFPKVGQSSEDRLWQSEASFSLTIPNPSNLDDWDGRQRVHVRRETEYEIRSAEGPSLDRTNVQFVVIDNAQDVQTSGDGTLQTLLGNLEFDTNIGKLDSVSVIRSNLPLMQNESALSLRPAKMEIRRID